MENARIVVNFVAKLWFLCPSWGGEWLLEGSRKVGCRGKLCACRWVFEGEIGFGWWKVCACKAWMLAEGWWDWRAHCRMVEV